MSKRAIMTCALLMAVSMPSVAHADFIRGVDISMQTRQEEGDAYSSGVTYYEFGVAKDALDILANHDVGWVRLRLFHAPDMTDYSTSMDLDYVATLGARAKAAGFKFLLDLHYSDKWADVTSQTKPAAWTDLTGTDLEDAVKSYTQDVIETLSADGAMPDMVQVGNEITYGMLWNDGKVLTTDGTKWPELAKLINAAVDGIDAGRGSEAMPEIMIHIDRGGDSTKTKWFFDNLIANGAKFDVIGQSFYPEWQGSLSSLEATVDYMAENYDKDIVLAEIGDYYYSSSDTSVSPSSQKEFIEDAIKIIQNAPNGRGRGIFYWEPTWVWSNNYGYRSLFAPINGDWDDVAMLPGLEAFNISRKFSTWSTDVTGSTSGALIDTHNSDNVYEAITEAVSGNASQLEHTWQFNLVNAPATFCVEAYQSASSDNDHFKFAYSTDGTAYSDMLTVNKTSDENTVQKFTLPSNVAGTIYVRVTDTDRTAGSTALDTIYIDKMYFSTSALANDTAAPAPNLMTFATAPYATGLHSIAMVATTAADDNGVEYYFTCTSGGGHSSGWQTSPAYEDKDLMAGATYTYTVTARDQSDNSNKTAASAVISATTQASSAGLVIENASFENDGLVYDTTPTGWTWNSEGGRGMVTWCTAGSYAVYMGNGAILSQTLNYTIPEEGISYALVADTVNTWQASPEIMLYYEADDGSHVELGSTSIPYGSDTWSSYCEIALTAASTADSVGKKLGIALTVANYPGNYWADFDNIHIDTLGWKSSDVFGWYYQLDAHWIYTKEHGYMYCFGYDQDSLFIYNYDFGWIWTSTEYYPYFYSYNYSTYFYYQKGTSNPRKFYNFATSTWINDTDL
jgi:arabinogalactan endo-1,4-beta-galactosidase